MNAATPTADAGGVPRHQLATDTWLGPQEISGLWEQGLSRSPDLPLFDKSPHIRALNARPRSSPMSSVWPPHRACWDRSLLCPEGLLNLSIHIQGRAVKGSLSFVPIPATTVILGSMWGTSLGCNFRRTWSSLAMSGSLPLLRSFEKAAICRTQATILALAFLITPSAGRSSPYRL